MRLKYRLAAAALAVSAFTVPAHADLTTPAEFAIIMDHDSGAVLFEKNADVQTAPASMSKLMTVAVVFEKLKSGELKLAEEFSVSEKAWRMGGSKMWVRVDTKISLENLLRGIIVQSGNDACVVVAENLAGSEDAFAELMNRKAREWGLNDSTFANATGWPDPRQKMSMRDLAKLTRKIIADYPEYYAMFAEREFVWEKIKQPNRNPILTTFPGADGLKTGHTEESGYGLAASAIVDGQRRIVVVNGLSSERERSVESTRLMRIAFNDFTNRTFYKAGAVVGDAEIFAGAAKTTPLVVAEDVAMIVPRSALDGVRATVIYQGPVAAPVRKGEEIGRLRLELANQTTREYPVYAGADVKSVGIFGRIGLAAVKLLAKPPAQETETLEAPRTMN